MKRFDFWLCASVALYVCNAAGWASYLIWRIWHG